MAFFKTLKYMNLNVREIGPITVIDIEGQIDINSSELIETIGWLVKNDRIKIVCNLEKVELVDYSGLSIFAIAFKNVSNHNGELKFCNIPLHLMELFRIVQLDTIFTFYSSEDSAIKSFTEPSEIEKKSLRRKFRRAFVQIGVRYKAITKNDETNQFHEGKVLNIGGEGMYIYTDKIFPVGTRLEIELKLEHINKPILINGVVLWVPDRELQPHSYPGIGIQFLKLGHSTQKTIVEYINKHTIHRSGFSDTDHL